jgi:hypothetical protein
VDWEDARFPGSGGLRRRVEAVCGPAAGLKDLGHRFGDWIEYGRGAPPATVDVVEKRIAEYLNQATGVGHRWGKTVGFGLGIAIGFVLLVGVGVWAVFR